MAKRTQMDEVDIVRAERSLWATRRIRPDADIAHRRLPVPGSFFGDPRDPAVFVFTPREMK